MSLTSLGKPSANDTCTDRHAHANDSAPVKAPTVAAEYAPQTTEYSYDFGSSPVVRLYDYDDTLGFWIRRVVDIHCGLSKAPKELSVN